jgi:hypothetical protein
VVINDVMARELWPGASALGQRIRVWSKGKPEPSQEVVGVVTERALTLAGPQGQTILRPYGPTQGGTLTIRTRGERGAAMLTVWKAVKTSAAG